MATEATRPDADTDAGVEIGAVSVPACPDHEEEMREEYEGGR
jgi:hypothetical protein